MDSMTWHGNYVHTPKDETNGTPILVEEPHILECVAADANLCTCCCRDCVDFKGNRCICYKCRCGKL